MKRLVLATLAASMMALPIMQAEAAPLGAQQAKVEFVAQKRTVVVKRNVIVTKKVVVRSTRWNRGDRYADWRRHQRIRDWNHYGLRRPGVGQEWIRVGNDYLLVGTLSGVIGGMVAAN